MYRSVSSPLSFPSSEHQQLCFGAFPNPIGERMRLAICDKKSSLGISWEQTKPTGSGMDRTQTSIIISQIIVHTHNFLQCWENFRSTDKRRKKEKLKCSLKSIKDTNLVPFFTWTTFQAVPRDLPCQVTWDNASGCHCGNMGPKSSISPPHPSHAPPHPAG